MTVNFTPRRHQQHRLSLEDSNAKRTIDQVRQEGDAGQQRRTRPDRDRLKESYCRVMKQSLGENGGGYSSNHRFDNPFQAVDRKYVQQRTSTALRD